MTDGDIYNEAIEAIRAASRVVVEVGGDARHAGHEISALLDLTDSRRNFLEAEH